MEEEDEEDDEEEAYDAGEESVAVVGENGVKEFGHLAGLGLSSVFSSNRERVGEILVVGVCV